jgi:hypothetical protein
MKGAFEFRVVPRRKKGPVSAYALVRSGGKDKRTIYTVVKYRNGKGYRCTCPDSIFRMPRRCKHVRAMVVHEHVQKLTK